MLPAVLTALNRSASLGAVPIKNTCKPLVSASAQVRLWMSNSRKTAVLEVSSMTVTAKPAATKQIAPAPINVAATVMYEDKRIGFQTIQSNWVIRAAASGFNQSINAMAKNSTGKSPASRFERKSVINPF